MIQGDSKEYELLEKWAKTAPLTPGQKVVTVEIGVREGLGSKIIMDAIKGRGYTDYKHIGIDPYGNLKYQHYDNGPAYTADYTEGMRLTLQKDLSDYECFDLFHMTDTEFMKRYQDLTDFNLVHFDGPHMTRDVAQEIMYFAPKAGRQAHFIFDDYPKYDMNYLEVMLNWYGFVKHESGTNKVCYRRTY
jgi:hypothetical protein